MSEPLLTLDGLSRCFRSGGGFLRPARSMWAVRDVSLAIARGSVVGVVGESGCGKSTLARLALRLIEPTAGRITFDGQDLTTLPPPALRRMRRRMSMVFQDPYASLDPRFTVADVLAEAFSAQGERPAPGRIGALLGQVGLPPALATRHAHDLSGGQRQRVGIARALALQPDLVVLDEPTASLDVSIQAQIIALLTDLRRQQGLTYLFISHDLGLVRYFCDRIVVMYLGAVVEDLPSPRTTPRHPYTRALMASNFIPDPAQRKSLSLIEGEIPSPFALPQGCAFASRCPRAERRCGVEIPALHTAIDGHATACFFPMTKEPEQ